jgi:GLPGLI family protein
MDIFKWALGNEFADILGYKVQKATTRYGGRDWIAWFSSEIPYNDGPYKFCGLPGLILKLNDAEEHYVFEAVAIERPDETVLLEISKRDRVVTTRIKYLQAEENFRSDIISRGKDAGMSNKTQQIMARNMLKRNNPIEFE